MLQNLNRSLKINLARPEPSRSTWSSECLVALNAFCWLKQATRSKAAIRSTCAIPLDQVEWPSGAFCSASELRCRYRANQASFARAGLVECLKKAYFCSCFGLCSWLCSSRPCSLELPELSEKHICQKYVIRAWFDEFYLKCNKTTKH